MSQSLDLRGLDEIINRFETLAKEMPDLRRQMHTALSDKLKESLDAEIAVLVNDSHGTVRGWQEKAVGSGGGYAAIRAKSGESGPNSPGAITNYLENGHRIRPVGNGKNYRPRVHVPYVNGKHFYAAVRGKILSEVMSAGEELLGKIAKELNT